MFLWAKLLAHKSYVLSASLVAPSHGSFPNRAGWPRGCKAAWEKPPCDRHVLKLLVDFLS